MDRGLHLVGTVHTDHSGFRKLLNAFFTIQPSAITIEANGHTGSFRSNIDGLVLILDVLIDALGLETKEIERLYDYFREYGFEKRFGEVLMGGGFGQVHYIDPIVPSLGLEGRLDTQGKQKPQDSGIDTAEMAYERNRLLQGYSGFRDDFIFYLCQRFNVKANMASVIASFIADAMLSPNLVDSIQRETYLSTIDDSINHDQKQRLLARDAEMERKIREVWKSTDGNLMHVSGVAHIFGNYYNLYERLADLNPARHYLIKFKDAG